MQGASTWVGGGLNFDSVAGERKVAQRKFGDGMVVGVPQR